MALVLTLVLVLVLMLVVMLVREGKEVVVVAAV
jgi:hypothetical protein